MQGGRLAIGLFLEHFFGEYQSRVWWGASRAAEELGITLISYADDTQTDVEAALEGRRLYECADPVGLDGMIVLSPAVSGPEERRRLARFLECFSSIPAVHVGVDDEAFARVVPENFRGMSELVDHMIERHGRTRIAFIRGPEGVSDAEARFAAYRASLEAHGIPFRPGLVLPGDFNREAGTAAAARLAESGESFDAVVGANDYMAFYATRELKRRGYRIPDAVSIGGFDDFRAAKSCAPALCTVHQPMQEMGEAALRLVASMARGEASGPVRLAFPSPLVPRRSCGCILPGASGDSSSWARELLIGDESYAALVAALREDPGARFRALLEAAVSDACGRSVQVSAWRGLVPDMVRGVPARDAARVEREILDFLSALQDEMNDRAMLALIEEKSAFDQLSGRLIGSFDEGEIRNFLDGEISGRCSFLCASLYAPDGAAKAFYCTDESLEGISFEPSLLAPGGPESLPSRSDLLVLPLVARRESLGLLVCAADGNQPGFFEVLRRHLAGALEGTRLVAEARVHSAALERKVDERTAELARSADELARAVAELKETNEKLEQKSSVDEMTGLYNRRGFFELAGKQLDLARRRGSELLLIFIDVDSLKKINDLYGHAEGDAAIKAMAEALSASFRQTDVVARLGGDEFTILAIDTPMSECEKMIARAESLVAEYNARAGKPYALAFSCGAAASSNELAQGFDALMAEADARLYAAKRAKRPA
jgi:diguanylate cyclase (GGDEF)-like protein